jgi:uncharacterized protein (TIGR02246 family)
MATKLLSIVLVCAVLGGGVALGGVKATVGADAQAVRVPPPDSAPPLGVSSLAARSELAAFKKSIRALYDLKERAWAAGDAETIVTKFYAADAVSVGEGDPTTMVGREQFRATYRNYVRDVTAVRIESVRTVVNGNAGWDWTNFYATVRPEKAKEYPPPLVRVLFLWSKENGRWICKGDVFVNGGFKEAL